MQDSPFSETVETEIRAVRNYVIGFEAIIGFGIKISRKYRYRIGIGLEIAIKPISISFWFRNNKWIDIGFDIGFEFLHVGILKHLMANI